MTLYRAVSVTEMEDIRASGGRFRDSRNLTGEKGFFYSEKDAALLANSLAQMENERHVVVKTEAPSETISAGRPHMAAQEGPGVYLRIEDLESLGPAVEIMP